MGTVWVGTDVKLGREVAVKVMANALVGHPELMARFEREAKAVAQLRSTHVVEVYDYGVHESLPFIVMELLEGESLRGRLRRVGRIALRDAAIITDQIAKGLKAAHNAGLVHRDLKPSNVFIAVRDDVEIIKLLDFGVVKAIDGAGHTDMTASGTLLGTPQYMSPEQVRARRQVDPRSDLWSLGVIVFRLLTGINPFRGESVGDAALRICSDELPRVGDYCDDLPHELDDFFRRAFARDPDHRFQSADELSSSFRSICAQVASLPARTSSVGGPPPPPSRGGSPQAPGLPAPIPAAGRPAAPPAVAGANALAVAPIASATPPPMVRRLPRPVQGEGHTPISVSGVVQPPPPTPGRAPFPTPGGGAASATPLPLGAADTVDTRPAGLVFDIGDEDDGSGVHSSESWNVATRKMAPLDERLAAARAAAGLPSAPGASSAHTPVSVSTPGQLPAGAAAAMGPTGAAAGAASNSLGAIPGTSIPLTGAGIEGPPSIVGTMSIRGDLTALRGRLLQSPMTLVIGVAATVFVGGILAVVMLTPDDGPEEAAPSTVVTGRILRPSWTRLTRPEGDGDRADAVVEPTASGAPTEAPTSAPATTTTTTQRARTPGGSRPTKPRPKWF